MIQTKNTIAATSHSRGCEDQKREKGETRLPLWEVAGGEGGEGGAWISSKECIKGKELSDC